LNIEQLIANYKQLEDDYEKWIELRRESYIYQFRVRKALAAMKSPLSIPYKKYSSTARRAARKMLGKKRGYEVEHLVSLKLLWALGVSIEDANHKDNLCHLRKKENRRKSFKVDWDVFEKLYKDMI
jgi:hypothetical protein